MIIKIVCIILFKWVWIIIGMSVLVFLVCVLMMGFMMLKIKFIVLLIFLIMF